MSGSTPTGGQYPIPSSPFAARGRLKARERGIPFNLVLEITDTCSGGCLYCYSSSTEKSRNTIPIQRIRELIDEAAEIGIRGITWPGGDPLLHPHWIEALSYATKRGLYNLMFAPNLMTVTKEKARQLAQEVKIEIVMLHFDTLTPEIYAQLHRDPKTLEQKKRGYENLREAGIPPRQMYGCMSLSKPLMKDFRQTIDWFVDEVGVKNFFFSAYKPTGSFAPTQRHLEISLSDYREAFTYRAEKLRQPELLRMGVSDGVDFCQTHIYIKSDGGVIPCSLMREVVCGNIYEERLGRILEQNREELLFHYPIKGYCGEECENRDVCFGCRANAYHYLGDRQASDPKCWLNPTSHEI
ncbi:MAG: radical SAM protein [Candidatus Tectomicrobia bacterium]|uniref:Radical SAM protein n=1 Tax=Tectimicrobiota bacterium TaxID=2528274 RepID=A0A932CM55_UNCTE|nr:radical SAM protein [Candidatus Tectomicrobia bacterium]